MHHEHHYRNLERSRDHLTESMISLRSAVEAMTGDDWLDAAGLLRDVERDIAPRLSRLRTAASVRFDEHTRHPEFDLMRTGRTLFPDERAREPDPPSRPAPPTAAPPPSDFPNANVGAALVAHHGSIDAAMMAYEPDSPEFDHIQAYRYVVTGKRPVGWIPPIVSRDERDAA